MIGASGCPPVACTSVLDSLSTVRGWMSRAPAGTAVPPTVVGGGFRPCTRLRARREPVPAVRAPPAGGAGLAAAWYGRVSGHDLAAGDRCDGARRGFLEPVPPHDLPGAGRQDRRGPVRRWHRRLRRCGPASTHRAPAALLPRARAAEDRRPRKRRFCGRG